MNRVDMQRYINDTYDGLRTLEHAGNTFYCYDPSGELPDERCPYFVTVVGDDTYDTVSRLSAPDAFRLNIGLTKDGYTARFGRPPKNRDEHGVLHTGYDYAQRDRVLPHPHYATHYWVCVVNPGEGCLDEVRELLTEAYRFAQRKHANQLRHARS